MMNIEIANRLLQYRKRMGLSQEELAEKIGVSRQAVSKWERAEAAPDTDNLIELSKIYGVSLDEMLKGRPEADPNNTAEDPPTAGNSDTDSTSEVFNAEDGVEFWFELDDGGGDLEEDSSATEWKSIDELLESTQTGDRKTRRAGEAAVKEELKRIRQQQKQDDIVDAQWVSADAGSPGSQDGGDTGNADESEHLQD